MAWETIELTEDEKKAAAEIVLGWNWQIAEGHNYSFKFGLHTLTRYYESAPMEADQFKLVLKFLRTQDVEIININGKGIDLEGKWKAKDAWYQTMSGDRFEGTEQNRVRIYQTLVGKDGEDGADGPYGIENGCKYKVTHVFFWDVEAIPNLDEGEYVSSSGVQYVLQGVTRDKETGLFSCVLERRETVQQDIEYYGSVTTIFESREDAVHLGVKQDQVENTGDKSSAEGGVLVERHLTKNADCTTDVANVKITEQEVDDAVKGYRKTLRGTIETTTDRNQEQPLSAIGMKVGERRQSEKTPGGLYNNTTDAVTTEAAGKIVEECQKTIFEHQHSSVTNQIAAPEAGKEDVAAASDGVIHRQVARETEEGTWDVTEETRTELGVTAAVKGYRKTLRGTIETTTDRNQGQPLDNSDMKVGERRQSEKTPGGLYNNTTDAVTTEAAGKIVEECQKTIFEHQHSSVTNQIAAPEAGKEDVAAASGGVIHRQVARETEEGTWDVTAETRTELGVTSAVKGYRKTLRGTIETTTDRNQEQGLDSTNMVVGEQRQSEKTPGGLYNNTVTKVTAEAAGEIAGSCERQKLEHTDVSVENATEKPQTIEQTEETNKIKSRSIRETEEGTWDITTTTREYFPARRIETWSDDHYNYALIVYVNEVEPLTPSEGTSVTASKISGGETVPVVYTIPSTATVSCNYSHNGHGTFNGSVIVRDLRNNTGRTQTLYWEKTTADRTAKYFYFNKRGKMCYRIFKCNHYECYGPYRLVIENCASGEDIACLGWFSGARMASVDTAFGNRYTDVVAGAEVEVDEDDPAQSGGSAS